MPVTTLRFLDRAVALAGPPAILLAGVTSAAGRGAPGGQVPGATTGPVAA